MDCTRVMTHRSKLLWLVVVWIGSIVYSFRGPYSDVSICDCSLLDHCFLKLETLEVLTACSRDESSAIRRDMAAIHLKVLFLSPMCQP